MNDQDLEYIKLGKNVLDIEIETLIKLKKSIDENFINCVNLIYNSEGRIVVTGIGKSAIIGQKLVSTFNSTGTHSIFLHAADAIHGDLGMLKNEDIIICISKSGETNEIKSLVTILNNFGNKIIAITSSPNSFLSLNSDILLHIPVEYEAEPNNLAPTASSIAQMAIGDALASALLQKKGFSVEHFAKFHPGGAIGKKLYLKVSNIYKRNEKPQVLPDADIKTIIMEMTTKRLGATVVVDENGKLIGIITDGDLRRMLEADIKMKDVNAEMIMSRSPKTICENNLAASALEKMRLNSITQLVVTDDFDNYLGIIHIHDILREGIS
ncbi:MAG: KpsF/GutQ family sugar-phosphate isomerase [Saprospiraceae bacterium]